MNREWKNRKVERPPVDVDVEVARPEGQGQLAVSLARYTIESWRYTDNEGVDCECPLETYEYWRECEPAQ